MLIVEDLILCMEIRERELSLQPRAKLYVFGPSLR